MLKNQQQISIINALSVSPISDLLQEDESITKRVSLFSILEEKIPTSSSFANLQKSIKEAPTIDNVEVSPPFMEFKDGSEGMTMKQKLMIKNCGSKVAFIRILEPNSLTFKIDAVKQGMKLSPGLSLIRVVTYTFKRPSSIHAMIPIEINGEKIDYHLICTVSVPQLIIDPPLIDMGTMDIGCLSDVKQVSVRNYGGKNARFSVDLRQSQLKIRVAPMRGIIDPNSTLVLEIQVVGSCEGNVVTDFWLISTPNICIPLKANVIRPKLMFFHNGVEIDEFVFVNFTETFLNSQKTKTFLLKNFSSQPKTFTVLSELGGKLRSVKEIDTEIYPEFDAFKIHPLDGRLNPFEEVKLVIRFVPTVGKLHLLQRQYANSWLTYFAAIIKIVKADVVEIQNVLKGDDSRNANLELELRRIYDGKENSVVN